MAVILQDTDLPELLSWLEQHHPLSFMVYRELKSHLKGHSPDLEFFVDRWPHPQAVVARENPAGEQMMSKTGELRVFGVDEKALRNLLENPDIISWNQRIIFTKLLLLSRLMTVPVLMFQVLQTTQKLQDNLRLTPRDKVNLIPLQQQRQSGQRGVDVLSTFLPVTDTETVPTPYHA
ncbi:hypothetical protein ACOMHN_045104 [Nucella lapillus]